MDDRITTSRRSQWSKTLPDVGRHVEIYHGWNVYKAYWDGTVWRSSCAQHGTREGDAVAAVAWWREPVDMGRN